MAKTKQNSQESSAVTAESVQPVKALDANQIRIQELMARIEELEAENDKLRLKSFASIDTIIRKAHDRYTQVITENHVPLISERDTLASKLKADVVEETNRKIRDVSKLPDDLRKVAHYCAKLEKAALSVKAMHDEWSVKAKAKAKSTE